MGGGAQAAIQQILGHRSVGKRPAGTLVQDDVEELP
jgi:hypothetical protein